MSYGQAHPSNLVGKEVPKSCGRYFPYGRTAPRWSVASCLAADLRGRWAGQLAFAAFEWKERVLRLQREA
jgi:hypothetical protein